MEHAAKKLVGRLLPQGVLAGLLFGMMLCFSLIPCVSVQAETVIDSVEATVTQPVGGAKISATTVTSENGNYQAKFKAVHIWDGRDFGPTTPGGEFVAGDKYRIVVKFVPNTGYTFSDSYTASINGNAAARYTANDGSLCFAYIVTALPINSQETCIEVSSIAVKSNVQTPATGATITNPSCDIISNSEMTVQETGWINADTGTQGSGVFTAGNWYCYFLLRLEGDAYTEYKFAAKENMTLTVNGSKWTVTEATNGTDYATVRAISTTWTLTGDTPAHSHTAKAVAAKAATCTQAGNIAYYTCSGCDKWFKDAACKIEITDQNSVVISAIGHTWSEKIEDAAHLKEKAADCRFCNTYWYDCAVCNTISKTQFFTSDTQKGAHSYETEWNKGDASGHWHNCQYCGERDTVVAHVPGSAATETSPQTCVKCGYIIVPAKGHTTHNAVYVAAQEATCIRKGNEVYYTCSGCEKWFRDEECTEEIEDHSSVIISALGHNWSEKIEDKSHLKKAAADCRSCNVYWYDCVMCDAISSNKYFTGKTRGAHSYEDEWNEGDASGHWHDCQYCDAHDAVKAHIPGPSATEEKPQTCTECGYVIKDTLIEEDSKGTQTTNGETNPTNSDNKETSDELPEEGTTLEDDSGKAIYEIVIEGNTVEYVSTISRSTATVTIPSTVTIDNVTYKVTGIAENAFKNNKTVKKVVIGKNVTTIGNSAFSGAVKLKTVTIGANVTSIGDKAFYKCTALTKITIPSKVTKIGKSAFYGCKNLKNITIKTTKLTTKKVGSKAFYGIHKKATIKVPKSKLKAYKTMLKGKGLRKSISIEK